MRRAIYACGAALCFLLWLTFALSLTVTRMGRDSALYAQCFHAFSDTAHLGVPESAYDGIAEALGTYFSGGEADFPLLGSREVAHLADIRGLFELFDRAHLLLIPAGALLLLLLIRPDGRGFAWGVGLTALLIGAAAGYVILHFEDAFVLMHRLLFRNDLWRLDPGADLLICLMPQEMFVYLAGQLALRALPLGLLPPTAVAAILCVSDMRRKGGRKK